MELIGEHIECLTRIVFVVGEAQRQDGTLDRIETIRQSLSLIIDKALPMPCPSSPLSDDVRRHVDAGAKQRTQRIVAVESRERLANDVQREKGTKKGGIPLMVHEIGVGGCDEKNAGDLVVDGRRKKSVQITAEAVADVNDLIVVLKAIRENACAISSSPMFQQCPRCGLAFVRSSIVVGDHIEMVFLAEVSGEWGVELTAAAGRLRNDDANGMGRGCWRLEERRFDGMRIDERWNTDGGGMAMVLDETSKEP